ncbi:MAG TPA: hypothetical protein VGV41_22105 [Pseudolabrys sp.]|uniref:hypothetical protein n=1 Tax=Pseudolabrys sp. TaxID=1960880 RepID=UPI002DDD927B|nr:hypothetical protein [Pseudolabrys sp.]HEV2631326.1 hypothetical protein [Pseudolabrys sp.]
MLIRHGFALFCVLSFTACSSIAFRDPNEVAALPEQSTTTPHPNSLAAQMAAQWHHVPKPVSKEQFERDKSRCAMYGQIAPVGAGTPEIKSMAVFIECMKAKGYQPAVGSE